MRARSILIFCLFVFPSLASAKQAPQLPDWRLRGNANANVVVEEYFDVLTPETQSVEQSINKLLLKKFGDKIRFEARYFPSQDDDTPLALSTARRRMNAAIATDCAGKQSQYDAYLRELAELSIVSKIRMRISSFNRIAQKIGLDSSEFLSCVRSGVMKKKILSERVFAERKGVKDVTAYYSNAPRYFVNGVAVVPATFESVSERIEQLLDPTVLPIERAVNEFPRLLIGSYVPTDHLKNEIVDLQITSVVGDEQGEKLYFSGSGLFDGSGKVEFHGTLDVQSSLMSLTFAPNTNLSFDTHIPFEGAWDRSLQKTTAMQRGELEKTGTLRLQVSLPPLKTPNYSF